MVDRSSIQVLEHSNFVPRDTIYVDGFTFGVNVRKKNLGPLPTSVKAYNLHFHNKQDTISNVNLFSEMFELIFDLSTYQMYKGALWEGHYADLYTFKCLLAADPRKPRLLLVGPEHEYGVSFGFSSFNTSFIEVCNKIHSAKKSSVHRYAELIGVDTGNIVNLSLRDFIDHDIIYQFNDDETVSIIECNFNTPYSDPEPDLINTNKMYINDRALEYFDIFSCLRYAGRIENRFLAALLFSVVRHVMNEYPFTTYYRYLQSSFFNHVDADFFSRRQNPLLLKLMYYCAVFNMLGNYRLNMNFYIFYKGVFSCIKISPMKTRNINNTVKLIERIKVMDAHTLASSCFFYYSNNKIFTFNTNVDLELHSELSDLIESESETDEDGPFDIDEIPVMENIELGEVGMSESSDGESIINVPTDEEDDDEMEEENNEGDIEEENNEDEDYEMEDDDTDD